MSGTLPSLDAIVAFLAVLEEGSLSAAARRLGRAQPTVRRQIEGLEAEMGVALFTRAANGLAPTETARALLPRARALRAQGHAFHRAGTEDRDALSGPVRITASRIVATYLLPGILAPLLAEAPGIGLELAATDRVESVLRREADIAVRLLSPPRQAAVVLRKVAPLRLRLHAAPSLAGSLDPEAPLAHLLATAPFVWEDRNDGMARALSARGLAPPRRIVLRTDDPVAQLAHVAAGFGIGVCQERIAPALGLRPLAPDWAEDMPAWIAMHEDQRQVRRVRVVFDALVAALG
ncbi:LysR family transcriptional regulator [Jannaschia seohaensis]|uniref:DNA-binding transcriptional LysR family regulator n=1 Tax=Jannaschia seohaensis TaxID=475081 RepID=A0A2Y9C0Q3_9RHOB|nr:LysR family transcriptional regulator [Jannaschia seohaensis]PWJ18137.1 DNA-binding transcriptional LysR family regulator [Jannaschia seohaensis]SSA46662.1 DNA-binding transcriptional regulator, LysR family [Jannaschia seohaensis]